jgi:hypothetical protein
MFASSPFRRLLSFTLAAFLTLPMLAFAFGPIHSTLLIEPQQQFVLGGEQRGAFTVSGKNIGSVTVWVVERFASGDTLTRGIARPGAKVSLAFEKGSAAVIVNANPVKAQLKLVITGATTALGMRYEGAKE